MKFPTKSCKLFGGTLENLKIRNPRLIFIRKLSNLKVFIFLAFLISGFLICRFIICRFKPHNLRFCCFSFDSISNNISDKIYDENSLNRLNECLCVYFHETSQVKRANFHLAGAAIHSIIIMSSSEEFYEVFKILDERFATFRGKTTRQYLVHWKGYSEEQNRVENLMFFYPKSNR